MKRCQVHPFRLVGSEVRHLNVQLRSCTPNSKIVSSCDRIVWANKQKTVFFRYINMRHRGARRAVTTATMATKLRTRGAGLWAY